MSPLRRRRGAASADGPAGGVRVLLYGRPGCHLCDEARVVVEQVCRDRGVGWQEVDISEDPDLVAAYGELVPVTLVDGVRHDFWRVDAVRLGRALDG